MEAPFGEQPGEPDVLERYLKQLSDSLDTEVEDIGLIRRCLASSPQTPPHILAGLALEAAVALLERIAENPRTPAETLAQLAIHPDSEVRAAVAENAHTPFEVLESLAFDENLDVRYRMAETSHTPLELLDRLSRDDNPWVATRAQRTLLRLAPHEHEVRTLDTCRDLSGLAREIG